MARAMNPEFVPWHPDAAPMTPGVGEVVLHLTKTERDELLSLLEWAAQYGGPQKAPLTNVLRELVSAL